jgi:8-amino-7-oxononanoate synthase
MAVMTSDQGVTKKPVDLFAKCRSFTAARQVIAAGIYPFFHPTEPRDASVAVIDNAPRLMLGSNNYLGLTHHPEVIRRAKDATARFGTGCTGSRFLNGTLRLHEELEARLAAFLSREAALVFSTGYQANLAVVSSLVAAGDIVVQDRFCHASLVDGAQLARGTLIRFPHEDMAALARILEQHAVAKGVLCVTDGVFSMEGDLPNLPAIAALSRRHGARLLVDDAHAIGVLGARGAGSPEHFGLEQDVDLVTVTFSKSLASIGGAVAGPEDVIHYLRHHARPLIFSASLPPAAVATVLACLDVIEAEPERRRQLWTNATYLREGLQSLGFDTRPSASPVIPIVIGGMEETFTAWRALFDAGVFVNAVTPPAVHRSSCRLRLSAMATHTREQLDRALDAFATLRHACRGHARASSVTLHELSPAESLEPFIDVAWLVNRGDPVWVPPLRRNLKRLLDRRDHPFHRHAEVAYFIAIRNHEVVGRIAAILNHRYNEFHGERTGFFGFFDAVNDQEVTERLLDGAIRWLRARGLDRMVGPVSFSTNEECGVLVQGFESSPAVMMPHNPAYYSGLLERAGLTKIRDLLAYRLDIGDGPPRRLAAGLRRVGLDERQGIRIRPIDLKRLFAEIHTIRGLYHAAWEKNWGFVPMTEDEFEHVARDLRTVIDPSLCLIAENADHQAVAFSITLPDVNQAMKTLNGRLFPFGFLRYLRSKHKIDNLRVLTLGVDPRYRRRGIDAALYLHSWRIGHTKGYRTAEASWILEDNWPMRRAVERLGGRCLKTYRLYSRAL